MTILFADVDPRLGQGQHQNADAAEGHHREPRVGISAEKI